MRGSRWFDRANGSSRAGDEARQRFCRARPDKLPLPHTTPDCLVAARERHRERFEQSIIGDNRIDPSRFRPIQQVVPTAPYRFTRKRTPRFCEDVHSAAPSHTAGLSKRFDRVPLSEPASFHFVFQFRPLHIARFLRAAIFLSADNETPYRIAASVDANLLIAQRE
jgi:hypothetical protein